MAFSDDVMQLLAELLQSCQLALHAEAAVPSTTAQLHFQMCRPGLTESTQQPASRVGSHWVPPCPLLIDHM